MLHPKQFRVNEVWIAFKVNGAPLHTERDGDLNFFALMDAASCFMLSSAVVSASVAEPAKLESSRLLEQGKAHKNQLPRTLLIPADQPAEFLSAEARRQGIEVRRVEESQLPLLIGEAREAFQEHFGFGADPADSGSVH